MFIAVSSMIVLVLASVISPGRAEIQIFNNCPHPLHVYTKKSMEPKEAAPVLQQLIAGANVPMTLPGAAWNEQPWQVSIWAYQYLNGNGPLTKAEFRLNDPFPSEQYRVTQSPAYNLAIRITPVRGTYLETGGLCKDATSSQALINADVPFITCSKIVPFTPAHRYITYHVHFC